MRSAAFQIVLNAIEITPEGGTVTVATGPASYGGGGPGVESGQPTGRKLPGVGIAVEDTGPGFPEGDAGRVFDEFYSAKPGGTGLGLAIAKEEVERVHGTIEAGSRADGRDGARFSITLPAATRVAPT